MKRIAILLLLCLGSWRQGSTATVVGEINFVSNSPYSGFMLTADTSTGPRVTQLSYFPSTLPNGTTISWSYANKPCTSICGFLQQAYGDYNNGPTNFITPRQLSGITTLTSTQTLAYTTTADGSDVAIDMFLGTTQHGTDALEIIIYLHSPSSAQSFCAGGVSKGTFTGSGVTWNVSLVNGVTACFIPNNFADVLSGTIDIKAMFSYLLGQSIIASTAWYHGHAMGTEPRNGSGGLTYNSWAVQYNFLLKRDINPAANDNSPMWLEKAA